MLKEEKEIVEMLMTKFVLMNDFEKSFCQSLYKIRKGKFSLTEKQKKVLDKTNELYWNKKCDTKQADGDKVFLTEKILQSGASKKGGWSAAQLACFGERFEKGWRDRIIGKAFTKENIDKFLSLGNTGANHSNKARLTAQEKDEIVKLSIDCAEDYNPDHIIKWFQNKYLGI